MCYAIALLAFRESFGRRHSVAVNIIVPKFVCAQEKVPSLFPFLSHEHVKQRAVNTQQAIDVRYKLTSLTNGSKPVCKLKSSRWHVAGALPTRKRRVNNELFLHLYVIAETKAPV